MSAPSNDAAASIASPFTPLLSSSIGRKFVMAVTGALLLCFVIGHLLGNLQVFLGPDAFNTYAAFLQGLGGALWIIRAALLSIFILHVLTAFQLHQINRAARTVRYAEQARLKATTSSLYMVETGIVLLIFVIIHLLHFTFRTFHPEFAHLVDSHGRHDTYSMVILGFRNPAYCGVYIFSMVMLGMHLSHGISSAFQTLGFHHSYFQPRIRTLGCALGWGIALGYIAIPLSVQLGLLSGAGH